MEADVGHRTRPVPCSAAQVGPDWRPSLCREAGSAALCPPDVHYAEILFPRVGRKETKDNERLRVSPVQVRTPGGSHRFCRFPCGPVFITRHSCRDQKPGCRPFWLLVLSCAWMEPGSLKGCRSPGEDAGVATRSCPAQGSRPLCQWWRTDGSAAAGCFLPLKVLKGSPSPLYAVHLPLI